MAEYSQIATELFLGFLALFILTKILGKTTIAQITTFDFISAIVLGELVGNALYDDHIKLPKVLFAVGLWGLLIYAMEMITQKYRKTRAILEGKPTIIIKKGILDRGAMHNNKLDINQLQHLLRTKDVFSLQEVEYAVLETDGTISVLKKSTEASPTRKDLSLPKEEVVLPYTFINDGEVDYDNLAEAGLDEKWLMGQIKVHGANRFEDVFFAEWKDGESLYVVLK